MKPLFGIALLLAAEHGYERGDACGPCLWQSHLTAAVGQLFEDGRAEEFVVAHADVGSDGGVEAVVEASHATGTQAEAWYFLGIVVVADVFLLALELG